ncbi:MAG: 2,3-bisphosphoglycerate-independent phosphoglycerate mutase, partial [Paracoccaceae bacterium]
WDRVARAYDTLIHGAGEKFDDAATAIRTRYDQGETDEFISPCVIGDFAGVADGDGLFCLNFRADRVRELLAAIGAPDFSCFDPAPRPALAGMLGMVDYSTRHTAYMTACYPKQTIVNTLGAWVASRGLTQFRIAETEKYPHVTFFLNGGKETPETGEDRFMPPSPKVATYDLAPEMSALKVTEKLLQAIEKQYDLIVVNFANPDMVGHTGDLAAAIRACETVDGCLGRLLDALQTVGGAAIVTADHGNCETMIDASTGGPHTAHTTNPVPIAVFGAPPGATLRAGRLSDIAPTLLDLMNLAKPGEMTGESLLRS